MHFQGCDFAEIALCGVFSLFHMAPSAAGSGVQAFVGPQSASHLPQSFGWVSVASLDVLQAPRLGPITMALEA